MRHSLAISALGVAMLAALALGAAADEPAKPAAAKPDIPSQEELEKNFAAELSGATLVGHFTVDGKTGGPNPERYAIQKIEKVKGDTWRFDVRIVYGEHDVTVPLPLSVKWAGDTPVITLTDLTVPGLGTYTARVLIFRGAYAGMWSGGDHGGELFGRVEKAAKTDKK